MKLFVTGAAGFIGFFLSKRLLEDGYEVVGIDNMNPYYDVSLKKDRLIQLESFERFTFYQDDLADRQVMERIFSENSFDCVVNLAAQAGVRYSIDNPATYIDSNLTGFGNILEGCRNSKVSHLIYASSSSVYGFNEKTPFSVEDNVDYPVSLYAATKKANELMAHTYAHLYRLPVTGLRFFTVVGPWGRPDMAYYKFTKAIIEDRPIDVYNHGKMKRDFTCVHDIVEGIVRLIIKAPPASGEGPAPTQAPYKIYNIGNNNPVELGRFIEAIEKAVGKKAEKNMLPMQPGDVPVTYADIDALSADTGFKPSISIEESVEQFVKWYRDYYGC